MRKFIILSSLCLSVSGFSQEIGAVGKMLRNENKNFHQEHIVMPEHYRWQQAYDLGYSEVFVRVPEMGRFTIRLGEQEITNSNGLFRFFDVPAQPQELSIWLGGQLIYSLRLVPRDQSRMLLDFFSQKGLYLLEEQDLRNLNEVYYGNRWNDVWNHYYNAGKMIGNTDFNKFLEMYNRQSFDKDKLSFFRMQKKYTSFTTEQIAKLMKELAYDDNKLELAKEVYPLVVDPQNYYSLFEIFSFKSTAEKFRDFISNQR